MENQEGQDPNQQKGQFLDKNGNPLTGAALIAAQNAADKAAEQAAANQGPPEKSPEELAKAEATATGETEEVRIGKAIAAIRASNPDMSVEDVAKLVNLTFKKTETVASKVDKEAARVIDQVDNTYKDKIYLKKDEKRKYPLEREALNGYVVRQSYNKKDEENNDINVPARNLNEIAVYTKADFDRLNNAKVTEPGFKRMGLTVEVWHKPGDTDTVQD